MLEEVSEIICPACGGRCCSSFCVWARDQFGRLQQNPSHCDIENNKTYLMPIVPNNREDGFKYTECYYYHLGGCPDDLKPDICRYWFCDIWDEFVLGEIKVPRVWHQAKWITRYLLWKLGEK